MLRCGEIADSSNHPAGPLEGELHILFVYALKANCYYHFGNRMLYAK